jgi:hypothetical protein
MTLELATQVGAVIVTSLLLFFVTKPRTDLLKQEEEPRMIQGVRKYSNYHRQRFYSMSSRTSSIDS